MTTATVAFVLLVPKDGSGPWTQAVWATSNPSTHPDVVDVIDLNGGPARIFRRVPGTWRYEEG